MENTEELFCSLEKVTQDLKRHKIYLNSELSKIDREITDVNHYIEFYSLSASQGYKMAKLLKDCFVKRRNIKDEMEAINKILFMNVGFIGKGKGRNKLSQVKNKQYIPRILKELFENSLNACYLGKEEEHEA